MIFLKAPSLAYSREVHEKNSIFPISALSNAEILNWLKQQIYIIKLQPTCSTNLCIYFLFSICKSLHLSSNSCHVINCRSLHQCGCQVAWLYTWQFCFHKFIDTWKAWKQPCIWRWVSTGCQWLSVQAISNDTVSKSCKCKTGGI